MIGKENITKKEVIEFLNNVQGHLCCYSHPESTGRPTFCDCKFGGDKIGNAGERGNGCPEMRTIVGIFGLITDKEFEKLVKRAYKKKKKSFPTIWRPQWTEHK